VLVKLAQREYTSVFNLRYRSLKGNGYCCITAPCSNRWTYFQWVLINTDGYKLTLGACQQKASMGEWSLIPRYQLNSWLNTGSSVVYQMALQFKTANSAETQLPKSTWW
jgi:hypothetical protein